MGGNVMLKKLTRARVVGVGLAAVVIGAVAISPALGGPSLKQLVKKTVKKEVRKQVKGKVGPAGKTGTPGASALHPVPSGGTTRGAIGGDFHAFDASASDFGVDVTLPVPAANDLGDDEVSVNVDGWQDGGGQTAPTTTDTDPGCTGTPALPVAPPGKVCIYVSGADRAFNLTGYSVLFGTGESPFGFKLKWDVSGSGPGDTFVDATWAYRAP
jgi:hypothetical protein